MSEPEHPGFDEEASIFDMEDEEADARREAEAEADIAAGRVVRHERVAEWLRSIGTANVKPVPYSWRK
jgi:predicted transcriptional regulator